VVIFYFLLFVVGAIVGSFLNVVICRTHQNTSIIFGRSHCQQCRHQLRWYELMPVISFLLVRGKCRNCKSIISWQYLLVELATALLFVGITYYMSSGAVLLVGDWHTLVLWLCNLFIVCVFIVIFVYDLRWQLIPDRFTLPAIAVVVIANIITGVSIVSMLLAIAVGGGFFLLQFIVSQGKWIGGGDIRLGALIGAVVGWPVVIVALFLSYIIGAITLSPLLLSGRARLGALVPFGTFLVVGALVAMMWGDSIAGWYLSLL
jgi:prepilin signal peptidase PulO-like enzyme (type II secretory pathway)